MRFVFLLPLLLGLNFPPIVASETDKTVKLCWKYKSDGVTLEKSTETCNYYSTGDVSIKNAEEIKDKAYASCTKFLGAFNYIQSEKTSLKKKTSSEKYMYYCQTNT